MRFAQKITLLHCCFCVATSFNAYYLPTYVYAMLPTTNYRNTHQTSTGIRTCIFRETCDRLAIAIHRFIHLAKWTVVRETLDVLYNVELRPSRNIITKKLRKDAYNIIKSMYKLRNRSYNSVNSKNNISVRTGSLWCHSPGGRRCLLSGNPVRRKGNGSPRASTM